MNHFKSSLVKFSAVAALSLSGIATITLSKPQAVVQAATSVVRINYVPGYSIAVWNSYQNGHTTGQYLKDGTSWKVIRTATDSKGNKWYDLGVNQWIMAKYTGSSQAPSTTTASKVVSAAYKQLGKPYAWGAAGPYSFDCSGLVQYVFKQAGVSLPRTTWTQATAGTRVSLGALKPGDLLFFDNTNHVAIYIGGNQYIDAPTYGQPVRVQSMSAWYPQYAVRVL